MIILLLLAQLAFAPLAFAQPYVKANCQENTDYIIVNDYEYPCPVSIDVKGLPNGITEMEVIPKGLSEGLPFLFYIDKSENRKLEFYKMIYDKSQKEYFDKLNTSIKIPK